MWFGLPWLVDSKRGQMKQGRNVRGSSLLLSVPQHRPRNVNNGFVGKAGGNDERIFGSGSREKVPSELTSQRQTKYEDLRDDRNGRCFVVKVSDKRSDQQK